MKTRKSNNRRLPWASYMLLSVTCWLLSGCGKPPERLTERDQLLRNFLGIRSLVVEQEIPKNRGLIAVILLQFEDGRLVGRGLSNMIGSEFSLPDDILYAEVLWGEIDGSFQLLLGTPGMQTKSSSDFWQRLDGGRARVPSPQEWQYEDLSFEIVAFAASALGHDGERKEYFDGGFPAVSEATNTWGPLR